MDGFKINAFFSQHENLLSHRVIFENITDLITPFVRYNAFQLQPVAEELIRHMLSKHEIKEESLKIDYKFSRKIKSNVEPKKKREKDTELYGYYAYVAELEALKASKINQ